MGKRACAPYPMILLSKSYEPRSPSIGPLMRSTCACVGRGCWADPIAGRTARPRVTRVVRVTRVTTLARERRAIVMESTP